ncbi:MAG: hypothetical protein OEU36_22630 [Gammaproteobacteria bacterium]|nr:hypothetical protein [Gammaproteobacteria bacterium]
MVKIFLGFIALIVAGAPYSLRADCAVDPDAVWSKRAELITDDHAGADAIDQMIECYEDRVSGSNRDIAPYWKLMRALYFKGAFTLSRKGDQRLIFQRAIEVAETAIEVVKQSNILSTDLSSHELSSGDSTNDASVDAAAIHFWAAVSWGSWAKTAGKLRAARMGVADRIRDYATFVINLDSHYERAGGHRILGRLHAQAPRLPWVTWWVSREKAVHELERAFKLYPTDAHNALYFAQALLEYRPERSDEALAIIRNLIARGPDPDRIVEEQVVIDEARRYQAAHSSSR